ncbi:MAG TPA: hypothetical protein VFB27_14595 [Opitutaceae bacterium]|nr:hypothetical protein [Opitutaceae bacterium]
MSKVHLFLLAGLGASLVFVLLLIRRAVEGHEDHRGFHRGAGPDPDDTPADAAADAPSQNASSEEPAKK